MFVVVTFACLFKVSHVRSKRRTVSGAPYKYESEQKRLASVQCFIAFPPKSCPSKLTGFPLSSKRTKNVLEGLYPVCGRLCSDMRPCRSRAPRYGSVEEAKHHCSQYGTDYSIPSVHQLREYCLLLAECHDQLELWL